MVKDIESKSTITFGAYIAHTQLPPWGEIREQGQPLTWSRRENQHIQHIFTCPESPFVKTMLLNRNDLAIMFESQARLQEPETV